MSTIVPHVALVQVQAARDHVAGEEDVGQTVVVDVPDGDARAIVDVDVVLHVHRVVRGDRVREGDARPGRTQEPEYRLLAPPGAAGSRPNEDDRRCKRTRSIHAPQADALTGVKLAPSNLRRGPSVPEFQQFAGSYRILPVSCSATEMNPTTHRTERTPRPVRTRTRAAVVAF